MDRSNDLALLSLPSKEEKYPFLKVSRNIPPEGKPCYLLGSPIFRHNLLLTGHVARRKVGFEWYDDGFAGTFAIAGIGAGGTSGGPWLNAKGEIIGVQVASMTLGVAHQGVASAIPPRAILALMESRKTVVAPTMQAAVEEIWGQSPEFLEKLKADTRGLVLRQVAKGGIAGKDKIYERIEPFIKMLRSKKPGDSLKLVVGDSRGDRKREVTLKLAGLK